MDHKYRSTNQECCLWLPLKVIFFFSEMHSENEAAVSCFILKESVFSLIVYQPKQRKRTFQDFDQVKVNLHVSKGKQLI